MTKKHFIALADAIKADRAAFSDEAISVLGAFCQRENFMFKADRWLDYINGKCGKNGGKVK